MTARIAALAAALILLGGCSWFDDLFGEEDEDLLPGERISVLVLQRALEADPALAERPVALPAPAAGDEWPVPWGTPTHAPQRPAAAETFGLQWRRGAGAGESGENAILSGPAIAAGRAYAMDAESKVAAVDLQTGARAWTVDLLRSGENEDLSLGGGVAFADGILFAATPFGDVAAIDADTGAVVWRRTVSSVFRAAPAVAGGRVSPSAPTTACSRSTPPGANNYGRMKALPNPPACSAPPCPPSSANWSSPPTRPARCSPSASKTGASHGAIR